MCEIKPRSKRCHVDTATHEQWKAGGEGREWLELALAESLERVGAHGKKQHKKLRVEFCARVVLVRERMQQKEKEISGSWMTEERMKKSGDFSQESIRSIIQYCEKFPSALIRPGEWPNDMSSDTSILGAAWAQRKSGRGNMTTQSVNTLSRQRPSKQSKRVK
ncbi:Uncharacterized protein SCF082_LOCUS38 [Durusdinium trenchii]|uniref:Uncharacterized protein n=1 Tax=Durusdinium trenchii TaxID=1381693 RepID=A0ABP0H8N3_9DINO